MTKINLSTEDIEANKQGKLSDKQRQEIIVQRSLWVIGTLVLIGVMLGLLAILLIKLNNPDFADNGELFIIVPVLIFWIWILRRMPLNWRLANLDLASGNIHFTEGMVQTDNKFGIGLIRSMSHYIHINNLSFRITKDQQLLFELGKVYRIYHTKHSKQFLGALLLVELDHKPEPIPLPEPLTTREYEILQLIASGFTNRQIGAQLSLSVNTIKMYSSQLYEKLSVKRRTEAVKRAKELKLL